MRMQQMGGSHQGCDRDERSNHCCQTSVCCPCPKEGGQEGPPGQPVHPEDGRHEDAANGRHATDGNGWIFHANNAPATEVLHPSPDPSPAQVAPATSCAKTRLHASHGYGRSQSPQSWRTKSRWSAKSPNGPARTSANGHDGQTRNAPCPHGRSSGPSSAAELQVYSNCQEPTRSSDPRTNGCRTWRSSSSTAAGCTGSRPGATHCQYVGCCSSSGTEADVG